MNQMFEWIKTHKPHTAAIAVAVIVIVCLAVAAASGVFSATAPEDQIKTADVTVNVTADEGWDENSTPALTHITGEGVDFYHAVNPDAQGNQGTSTVTLAEGDYTVSFISPLSFDGLTYEIYDTGEPQQVTIDTGVENQPSIDCSMTLIHANQVTDEMVQDIIDATKAAVENGDETLKGDAGQGVLDKLEQSVGKDSNASDETEQEATDADKEASPDSEPATPAPSQSAQSGNTGNGNTNTSTNTGNNGGNTSTSGGNSGGNSGNASQPTHTHTWVDHTATKQVWVSNMVTVPDYETETIYGARFYIPNGDGSYIAKGPTYWFEDGFTIDDLKEIIVNAMKNADENGLYNGVYYGNYQNVTKTEQVQVGSHQEDQGHYETQTYVDYQYCSVCGQRK